MLGVRLAGGPPGGGPAARGVTRLVPYNPQSATGARLEDISEELGAQHIIGLTGTMRKFIGKMVEAYQITTNHLAIHCGRVAQKQKIQQTLLSCLSVKSDAAKQLPCGCNLVSWRT